MCEVVAHLATQLDSAPNLVVNSMVQLILEMVQFQADFVRDALVFRLDGDLKVDVMGVDEPATAIFQKWEQHGHLSPPQTLLDLAQVTVDEIGRMNEWSAIAQIDSAGLLRDGRACL